MTSPLLVYLASLNHGAAPGFIGDVFPLQLGMLAAYGQSRLGTAVTFQLFAGVAALDAAMARRLPHVVGFSRYVWNGDLVNRCLARLKARHPHLLTVVGGPDYPLDRAAQEAWLLAHPAVDFYIYRDGEIPLAGLLAALLAGKGVAELKTMGLPGCHSVWDGRAVFGPIPPRVADLDQIPSPYLTGFMDSFFATAMRPMMLTSRGCPYTCTFCVEGDGYYNRVAFTSRERRQSELNYIAQRVSHSPILKLADSNFGQFPGDPEFARMVGALRQRTGYPDYLYCSAGKAHAPRILRCRELAGESTMRLATSVQSLDAGVLAHVRRRNLPLPDLLAIGQASGQQGSNPCDLILGLPGEDLASAKRSLEGVVDLGVGAVIQRQFMMLRGSASERQESRQQFALQTRFRPLVGCAGRYRFLGQEIRSSEYEEVVVASNDLSFEDYLEARDYYLTIALFFNDWLFGEIRALLGVLGLPVSGWIRRLHQERRHRAGALQGLYDEFTAATASELRQTPAAEDAGVAANLLMHFRLRAVRDHWQALLDHAFGGLRRHLAMHRPGDHAVLLAAEAERYCQGAKRQLFDPHWREEGVFTHDWPQLMASPGRAALTPWPQPVLLRFAHSDAQRQLLAGVLHTVGGDGRQLDYMLSRYPVSRFFRPAVQAHCGSPGIIPPGGNAKP